MTRVKALKPNLETFGGRLRAARMEVGLKAPHVCNILNGYLKAQGLSPVNINTFYSWEHIGTPKEVLKGKSYPHPSIYNIFASIYGVTGYWLFFGSMGGQVERYRQNMRMPGTIDPAMEQRKALKPEERVHSRIELLFRKVLWESNTKQKRAIELLLESFVRDSQ